jgi:hypothetical protein
MRRGSRCGQGHRGDFPFHNRVALKRKDRTACSNTESGQPHADHAEHAVQIISLDLVDVHDIEPFATDAKEDGLVATLVKRPKVRHGRELRATSRQRLVAELSHPQDWTVPTCQRVLPCVPKLDKRAKYTLDITLGRVHLAAKFGHAPRLITFGPLFE